MKTRLLLFPCLLMGAFVASAAPSVDVVAPSKRAASVEIAKQLVAPVAPAASESGLINPFTQDASRMPSGKKSTEDTAAATAAILASNQKLVAALADRVEARGAFVLGGEPILLVGQKKLKKGDLHAITFEGTTYEVEITAIETTRFSVRYKNEEVTRAIVTNKSGK